MKNQCFIIAFVFAALCTMSAFGYQTEYQPNSGSQHAFMEKSDVVALNSELLSNDGAVQISRVLNGLLKSDVAQKGKSSSKKAEAAKYYKQALNLLDDEEYEEALDFINKALKLDRGNSKYEQLKEDIEDAIEELEQQEEAKEHSDRAKDLLKKEKFDEAERAIDKALKMFPDNRNYKRIKEKIEDAKEEYENIQKQEEAEELLGQAQSLLKNDKFNDALKKVDKAEDIYPDDKSKYNSLRRKIENARIEYEEQKKLEEAASLANQALECLNQNRFDEALNHIENALAIDPGNGEYKKIKEKIELAKDPFSTTGKEAGARAVKEINGVEFAFRWCPAGSFMMGKDEFHLQKHQVTLTRGFWMMETEVTVGMFKAFVSDANYDYSWKLPSYLKNRNDIPFDSEAIEESRKYSWRNLPFDDESRFSQDDSHPVIYISWDDAGAFCKWLSQKTGLDVQLPTSAQWEYACRAGTTGDYAGNLDDMAWYEKNSGERTHSVATKKPNPWGIYDMHGNVFEWCQDWERDYPSWSETDPVGQQNGPLPIFRGGGYSFFADSCTSWALVHFRPSGLGDNRNVFTGFRCLAMPNP